MPAIPPDIGRDSVVFLYRTVEEAEQHARRGGAGFIIGLPARGAPDGRNLAYIVSNRHVVWEYSSTVMRVNRRDGLPPDVFDIDQNAWVVSADDDLAILNAGYLKSVSGASLNAATHDVSFIGEENFVTPAFIEKHDIDVGEEVFMSGRFVNLQGKRNNKPAMRFGCISMMAEGLWNRAIRKEQIGFAVEMRSRTGFSGSPVFVYGDTHSTFKTRKSGNYDFFWGLLGVNWGYVLDSEANELGEHENTWLNGVVPAWKILEMFETPKLKSERERMEAAIIRSLKPDPSDGAALAVADKAPQAVLSKPAPTPTEGDERHKERFTALLDAAAGKSKQAG